MQKKFIASITSLFLAAFWGSAALSQSMEEALILTYEKNPTLEGERRHLEQLYEGIPQARSAWMPQVSVSGSDGRQQLVIDGNPNGYPQFSRPVQIVATMNQALYHGGGIEAGVDQASGASSAEEQVLRSVEQSVLVASAMAYLDVLRDQDILKLSVESEANIRQEREFVHARFLQREQTNADVSQADSRYEQALAVRISAELQLTVSRGNFELAIGRSPQDVRWPDDLDGLPQTSDQVAAAAEVDFPDILAAQYNLKAATANIGVQEAKLLPSFDLIAQKARYWNQSALNFQGQYNFSLIGIQLSIPLYSGGQLSAVLRAARKQAEQLEQTLSLAKRTALVSARQAWANLMASKAREREYDLQIISATNALASVKQQQILGARTILDVLNAEEELLTARIQAVTMRHDYLVSQYQVLAAMGGVTGDKLHLATSYYDYTDRRNEAEYKLLRP